MVKIFIIDYKIILIDPKIYVDISIYFRKQDNSYFRVGVVSLVLLRCSLAIFNKITKRSTVVLSPLELNVSFHKSIPVLLAKYSW